MLNRKLAVLVALSAVVMAKAQTPIPSFVSATKENFDAMAPGSKTSFPGFSGGAVFSRIGSGGAMIINNNTSILPFVSPKNDLFGRGVDVRITFNKKIMARFGGMFRAAKAGVNPTKVRMRFFRGGVAVGVAVLAPISNAAWKWVGYDLSKFNGYDEVRIFGVGGTLPGYVGMDNLVRK